jgi:hypothetical protein
MASCRGQRCLVLQWLSLSVRRCPSICPSAFFQPKDLSTMALIGIR